MTKTRHYCFALVEEFSHLAFSCAVEPLRIANFLSGEKLYEWSLASLNGIDAKSSNEVVTQVQHSFQTVPQCDQLFVLSGLHMQDHVSPDVLNLIRHSSRHGTPVGGLCSAAWILAEAGVLDGSSAAIHWDYHDSFVEKFPNIELVPSVFVSDAPYITASGGTATADLMLHLIARDHGMELSEAVADQMVYASARGSTARQTTSVQARNGMRNEKLMHAIRLMRESIEYPMTTAEIADEVGISSRQLERLFGQHMNRSPKKYFMELRMERARHLLIQTDASVAEVALACGFDSPGHFSRVYRTAFGIAPVAQRSRMN